MNQRFCLFLAVACMLLSACSASNATPNAVPATAAPTAIIQAPQPTAAPTVAPPTAAPTVVAPAQERTLSLQQPRLAGQDVQTVQQRLLDLGYAQLGQADGIFGPNTETSVRAFQALNQIAVDGIVGPDTRSLLYDLAAVRYDLHPVIDTQRNYLLGAANGTDWIAPITAASLLNEATYQLLHQSETAETATGSTPTAPDGPPCEDTQSVAFQPPVTADRPIALAAAWNALPRPVTDLPTDTAALQAPVARALRTLGLNNPQVRITRVLRADLANDGSEETILAATYRSSGLDFPQPSAKTGDYSLVLVVPDATQTASIIVSDVVTKDIEFGAPLEFRLLGLWDLNGDGTLEIVTTADYYEGASTSVYTMRGSAAKEVLSAGCGV